MAGNAQIFMACDRRPFDFGIAPAHLCTIQGKWKYGDENESRND